jgi:ubiquinone/menaquinone biosynthesis C-methylase UbiE
MSTELNKRVCPASLAGSLDNSARKILQNPRKILNPYITEGMTVLDLGCGPGYFSLEIAELVKDSGKVIAADLQEGMLEKVNNKIKGTDLEQRVTLHKCQTDRIGVAEKVDFALVFYMLHEVPDQDKFLQELKSLLNPGGRIYISEPKMHVSRKSFEKMIIKIEDTGFEIIERPKVFFSRTILLKIR